jgi:hypothetical protein
VIDRIGGIIPELYRNRIEFELSKITPIYIIFVFLDEEVVSEEYSVFAVQAFF